MVSPYLLPENREAYLRSKGLIEGDISDDDREWLYFINPHYLISYARNYQLLVEQNQITKPKTLSNIRGIVEADAQLAAILMPWMRTAELNLRALTLKHYCAGHQFGDGYLDISRWTRMQEGDDKRLQGALLNSISRCGEPHVTEHLDRKWAKTHTGDRPSCGWSFAAGYRYGRLSIVFRWAHWGSLLCAVACSRKKIHCLRPSPESWVLRRNILVPPLRVSASPETSCFTTNGCGCAPCRKARDCPKI